MLATIESGAVQGIDAYDVRVEVDVSSHITYFAIRSADLQGSSDFVGVSLWSRVECS